MICSFKCSLFEKAASLYRKNNTSAVVGQFCILIQLHSQCNFPSKKRPCRVDQLVSPSQPSLLPFSFFFGFSLHLLWNFFPLPSSPANQERGCCDALRCIKCWTCSQPVWLDPGHWRGWKQQFYSAVCTNTFDQFNWLKSLCICFYSSLLPFVPFSLPTQSDIFFFVGLIGQWLCCPLW